MLLVLLLDQPKNRLIAMDKIKNFCKLLYRNHCLMMKDQLEWNHLNQHNSRLYKTALNKILTIARLKTAIKIG